MSKKQEAILLSANKWIKWESQSVVATFVL